MIQVWDRIVRLAHWGIAFAVLSNFLNDSGSEWHRYGGYAAGVLVIARLLWGFTSRNHAAFRNWLPAPGNVLRYSVLFLRGRNPRYIGINPLGASMALLIWLLILALAVTGWMMGLDAFWGEEWLENLHEYIAYTLLGCVALHVTAVIALSIKHRENLPRAMITGQKRKHVVSDHSA